MVIFHPADRSRGYRVFLAGGKKASDAEAARNYIVTPRVFNLSTSIRVLPRVTSFETTWKLARFPPPCSHAFRILASLVEGEKDRHEDAILEIVGYFQGNIFAETRGKGLVIRETNDAILETVDGYF